MFKEKIFNFLAIHVSRLNKVFFLSFDINFLWSSNTEEIVGTKLVEKNTCKNHKNHQRDIEKWDIVLMSLGDTNMYIIAKNHDKHLLRRPDYRRRHSIKHWLPCFSRMIVIYIISLSSYRYTTHWYILLMFFIVIFDSSCVYDDISFYRYLFIFMDIFTL